MPSKTPRQRRMMAAACADPRVARRVGVPRSVACEFAAADRTKPKRPKSGRPAPRR